MSNTKLASIKLLFTLLPPNAATGVCNIGHTLFVFVLP
jgi:hypothetical protein